MNRTFARTVDVSSVTDHLGMAPSPVRGAGGAVHTAAPNRFGSLKKGTGSAMAHPGMRGTGSIEGSGAIISPEADTLLTYGLSSGAMFYGVMLAIKGKLAMGAAAFIGGPIAVGFVMMQVAKLTADS